MKGIVMNLLNEMVEQTAGLAEWNAVLQEAGVSGAYTAAGLYDDAELLTLVEIISRRTGTPVPDLVFAFGEFMFPEFKARYPELIDENMPFIDFLATIDDVIHVEVKKLYPDAVVPGFDYIRHSENQLELQYRSARKLCPLAEGLVTGAAKHFGTSCTIQHSPCMHDGADYCGLLVTQS